MGSKIKGMCIAAVIAAMYTVLTLISSILSLDKGLVQFRLSEALTVLPFFTFYAIPGVTVGCLAAGIICGNVMQDVLFGSAVTLVASVLSYGIGKICGKIKFLVTVPPILLNAFYVPIALKLWYGIGMAYFPIFVFAFAGEALTAGVLGTMIMYNKNVNDIFRKGQQI